MQNLFMFAIDHVLGKLGMKRESQFAARLQALEGSKILKSSKIFGLLPCAVMTQTFTHSQLT